MKYEPQRDVENTLSFKTYKNISAMPHFHRSIELIFVESGRLHARVSMLEDIFEGGDILFVPSYFVHSVKSEPGTLSHTFIIPYDYFSAYHENKIPLLFFALKNREANRILFENVYEIAQALEHGKSRVFAKALTETLLGRIADRYDSEFADRKESNLMIDVIQYIEEHFRDRLTLDAVASHFGYSKYYFSKLFNELFGCHLTTYINCVRANYVTDRISTDKNMTDLILEAGFGDTSTYYRTRNKEM